MLNQKPKKDEATVRKPSKYCDLSPLGKKITSKGNSPDGGAGSCSMSSKHAPHKPTRLLSPVYENGISSGFGYCYCYCRTATYFVCLFIKSLLVSDPSTSYKYKNVPTNMAFDLLLDIYT